MSKHLTLEDRKNMESLLKEGVSFKEIGRRIGKDCTAVSKEIRKNYETKKTGAYGQPHNACKNRFGCHKPSVCTSKQCERKNCHTCVLCNSLCNHFEEETCPLLDKPPYVCNGCGKRKNCTLVKRIYDGRSAHSMYKSVLSESRSGVAITEKELRALDELVTPLLKRGQSVNHILTANKDRIMYSGKTLYNYIDSGLLTARNLDMPRKVRFRMRKKPGPDLKVDKKCRIGRTYEDFQLFMKEPNAPHVVQMDTYEGRKGGKVLLTLHFALAKFMLAFIRDHNDSQSVIDVFDHLTELLGLELFMKLLPLLLGDNGSEFSNPYDIERHKGTGILRTKVFYCDPNAPQQRGAQENNHSDIRRILPKGVSFDHLKQADINKIMNNVNSYLRPSFGDKSAHEIFTFMYGEEAVKKLGCILIPPNEVCMNPSLLNP